MTRNGPGFAGFDLATVTDEYTHEVVGESTLRATWIARRHPTPV